MSEPAEQVVPVPAALPRFDVQVAAPDLSPWLDGNTGVPGFYSFDAPEAGPHVALISLVHGNELAGAIVLDRLLRAGVRPLRGRLTLGFANLAAFARFDPAAPTVSRFLDEDLNRLWDSAVLDGPRRSLELTRARQMRPLIDTVDVLLDLHSMLWPSDPLVLSGATVKGRDLALAIRTPDLVVADRGHVSGRRLIDYGRFADADAPQVASLVEAGQHWDTSTVDVTLASVAGLLRHLGVVAEHPALAPAAVHGHARAADPAAARRFAEVSMAVTATTSSFAFVRAFRGGDVLPRGNTLIAMDGAAEIRTPHDDCLMVMPSLRPSRGHTAVRLARFSAI
jgi:predicted deacylase